MLSNEEFKAGVLEKAQKLERNRRRKRKIAASVITPCVCVALAAGVLAMNGYWFSQNGSQNENYFFSRSESKQDLCDVIPANDVYKSDEADEAKYVSPYEEHFEQVPKSEITLDDKNEAESDDGLYAFTVSGGLNIEVGDLAVIHTQAELSNILTGTGIDKNTSDMLEKKLHDNNIVVLIALPDDGEYSLQKITFGENYITVCLNRDESGSEGGKVRYSAVFIPKEKYKEQTVRVTFKETQ